MSHYMSKVLKAFWWLRAYFKWLCSAVLSHIHARSGAEWRFQPDNPNIRLNIYYSGSGCSSMMSQSAMSGFCHTKPFAFCLTITVPGVGIYQMATFNFNLKNPWLQEENISTATENLHVGLFCLPEVAFSLRCLAVRCLLLLYGLRFLLYFFTPWTHNNYNTSPHLWSTTGMTCICTEHLTCIDSFNPK